METPFPTPDNVVRIAFVPTSVMGRRMSDQQLIATSVVVTIVVLCILAVWIASHIDQKSV